MQKIYLSQLRTNLSAVPESCRCVISRDGLNVSVVVSIDGVSRERSVISDAVSMEMQPVGHIITQLFSELVAALDRLELEEMGLVSAGVAHVKQ